MQEMIRLEGVSKIYSNETSSSIGIQNVSASFSLGEFVAITGESGSGKSTFLNVVSLLDSYEEGELFIDGKSTAEFTKEDFAKYQANYVSFVFQEYNIIESFDCLTNVELPLLAKGIPSKEAKERAYEALDQVGLKNIAHQKASKLSGGQKQRVVIARALVSDTPVLACDEPTGNLDSATGKEIIELFKRVGKNKLVFFVTHDFDSVSDVATRHLEIKDGHIIKDEKLKEIPECAKITVEEKKRTNFWHRFFLGAKDVFSTPKKSLLSFVIALLVALGGMSIAFGSLATIDSLSSSINVTNRQYSYSLVAANRVMAFDRGTGGTSLSSYSFPDDAYVDYGNTMSNLHYFYAHEDNKEISNTPIYSFDNGGVFYDGYSLISGRAPQNESEAVVIFPNVYSDSQNKKKAVNKYIGRTFLMNPYSSGGNAKGADTTFKIVGAYKTNWVNGPTSEYLAFSKEGYSVISNKLDSYLTSDNISIYDLNQVGRNILDPDESYSSVSFTMDGTTLNNSYTLYTAYYNYLSLNKVYVADELLGEDLKVDIDGVSFTIPSSSLNAFPSGLGITSTLSCSFPSLYIALKGKAPLASAFFSSSAEAKSVANDLLNQKIDAKTADYPDKIYQTANYLIIIAIVAMVALFVLSGVLLAFIGALLFRIVYASKRKDYAIYTTLSFSLNDVRWINFAEILIYFLAASLVSFLALYVIANNVTNEIAVIAFAPLSKMFGNPLAVAIYFLSMFAYAFLISMWTMKRLYKKNRAENLRKDDSLI